MIKCKLNYVSIGVIKPVVNTALDPDFGIFWGYDPDELSWLPTALRIRKFLNGDYQDKFYELYESELTDWLSERLKQ